MEKLFLKNGLILKNGQLVKCDILIENGIISGLVYNSFFDLKIPNLKIIDLSECWVIPGTIDIHAHFREPGFSEKETIKNGSMSAAKGGITTAFAMPNLCPVPDSVKNLEIENEIIKRDSVIKILPYASVTKDENGQELSDMEALADKVIGFSDDGKCVNNLNLLKQAMVIAKQHNKIISSHAEAKNVCDADAEYIAVKREIELVKQINCKYHFCHISDERSFSIIEQAQKAGYDITCEVTPHHLFLCDSDIKNANFKMNPPLKLKENMEATRDALLKGVATIVATDHAPHTEIEKAQAYEKAPNGVIGFETMLPMLYTNLIKTKRATHADFLNWVLYNPAKRFGIKPDKIEIGKQANLAVLDIKNPHIYQKKEILSKGKNSPFIGKELYGMNILTLHNGKIVFKDYKKFSK